MDSAPTIPRERITLEVTASITRDVIIVRAISEVLKLFEYITPLKVFLYTTYINSPIQNASPKANAPSTNDILVAFSRKFDLNMSLKLVCLSILIASIQYLVYTLVHRLIFTRTYGKVRIWIQIFCFFHQVE